MTHPEELQQRYGFNTVDFAVLADSCQGIMLCRTRRFFGDASKSLITFCTLWIASHSINVFDIRKLGKSRIDLEDVYAGFDIETIFNRGEHLISWKHARACIYMTYPLQLLPDLCFRVSTWYRL